MASLRRRQMVSRPKALHFAGNMTVEPTRIEELYLGGTGPTSDQRVPKGFKTDPDWTDHAEPCDKDASHGAARL
jgi:hypothetical protein